MIAFRLIVRPQWAVLPIVLSGALLLAALLAAHRGRLTTASNVSASTVEPEAAAQAGQPVELDYAPPSQLGLKHELTYEQWVRLLKREAAAIAQQQPERLYVLAGDSLSLWFPAELLPEAVTWLNQGISGETSYGLLRRLKGFDQTNPQIIFVMIGINDLIRGVRKDTLVENHREIIRHLKSAHPRAKIVVQSILPHGGDRASQRYLTSTKGDPAPAQNPPPLWVKRLPKISNRQIQKLNQRLAIVSREEKVEFLDIHSLFANSEGYLHDNLTTDGLHLSHQGYALWRSQLEPYLPPTVAGKETPDPDSSL